MMVLCKYRLSSIVKGRSQSRIDKVRRPRETNSFHNLGVNTIKFGGGKLNLRPREELHWLSPSR